MSISVNYGKLTVSANRRKETLGIIIIIILPLVVENIIY